MHQLLKRQSGFTLVEALLQLMLFIVFCQLIGLIFLSVYTLSDPKTKRVEMDWEITVTEIGQYVTDVKVHVSADGQIAYLGALNSAHENRLVILNQTIFYSRNGGFETLLHGFQWARFSLDGYELRLQAILESGEERSRTFIVVPTS